MRRRPERARFPAWVEDGATYSASEVFLDPLSPLYPCLGLASPQLLHPRGLSVKPLPRPLMHPLASPGQSQARPVQSSSGVSHYLLPGLIVWWGPVSLQPPPPLPGDAPRYWPHECGHPLLVFSESPAPQGPGIMGRCLSGEGGLAGAWAEAA